MRASPPRVVAFYLPQFHPIPENDHWWGTGFTEWTNVSRARPLFRGHRQPRVADRPRLLRPAPARDPGRAGGAGSGDGVSGFCYWHYWFHGKRLLERPFEEVLKSGAPDFPFCLAWANEPWTRTWLGRGEVLQEQRYSRDDDLDHSRWLLTALADDRALRVYGRAVFLVYRPNDLPDPRRTTDTLRSECVRAGPTRALPRRDQLVESHDRLPHAGIRRYARLRTPARRPARRLQRRAEPAQVASQRCASG